MRVAKSIRELRLRQIVKALAASFDVNAGIPVFLEISANTQVSADKPTRVNANEVLRA